jgi:SAM-dependent methyltransferase
LALDFAVELRRRGLAPSTVRRRLNTLSSLAGMAGELGVVEWSLEVPNEEEVAAAEQAGQRGATGNMPYLLPHHTTEPAEIDRLDVQHYALRQALEADFLAPVQRPERILDVGTGTGQWAFDQCARFPEALVSGFDLEPSKPEAPPNYRLVRGNLLQGLPFASGSFDFVHQRLLMLAVPLRLWAGVVDELVRVLQPGGWLELVEGNVEFEASGPATDRLAELLRRLARVSGIDSTGIIFRSLQDQLARRGMAEIERRTVSIPLGEWGGRLGSLLASDCRAMYLRLSDTFEAKFDVPVPECHDLVARAQLEWEELHTRYSFVVAYGRKPG